jgi:hypothetical protein
MENEVALRKKNKNKKLCQSDFYLNTLVSRIIGCYQIFSIPGDKNPYESVSFSRVSYSSYFVSSSLYSCIKSLSFISGIYSNNTLNYWCSLQSY